jgi:hypothetical protein
MAGSGREYIRGKTPGGHQAAHARAKAAGRAVTRPGTLPMALHLPGQGNMSLRGFAGQLVITTLFIFQFRI